MKRTYSCDILVVGAGPAGGSVALAAARKGARVLVVDRRQVVGMPVRCAEYIPAMLMDRLDLGKSFIVQSIRGMKTYRPGEPARELFAPGFTIHRDLFDQAMICAAIDSGAGLMTSTRAVRRIDDETVLLKRRDGQSAKVCAKIIVGADGPHSTVGRWVGAANNSLLPGVQATLPLVAPMDWSEVYFEPEIDADYGWMFPKKDVANIGIGLRAIPQNHPRTRAVLARFIRRIRASGRVTGQAVGYTAGWIPSEPVRQAVYGNLLLVGDAAGQAHPMAGAGIANAVICGEMAAKWAVRSIEQDDPGLLQRYDHQRLEPFRGTVDHVNPRLQTLEPSLRRLPAQC